MSSSQAGAMNGQCGAPNLWLLQRLKIFVEDKIYMGTECEEIKPSTSNKEGDQVEGKNTVPKSTTPGTD